MSSPHRILLWPFLALALLATATVLGVADLEPQVESDFFFATDDPQFEASRKIGELFPQSPQILISATGPDVLSEDYLERLRSLSEALAAESGVLDVRSLTHGPANPQSVATSPIWSRLLLGSNPHISQLVVGVDAEAGRDLVERLEALIQDHSSPSFILRMSGVPVVVELIRRHLSRDLRVFSGASLLVFGLLIAAVYRSLRIVAGTLVTCLGACAITLALLHLLDKPIGLLTANIVTIVFVLTLSHIVFLTANWHHESSSPANENEAVDRAVRRTGVASFWCMLTTFLGFSSLLLASARPLRELGFAGALGTAVAILVAYAIYPGFLPKGATGGKTRPSSERPFPLRPGLGAAVGLLALVFLSALGLPRIDTDPPLLSYFSAKSEIRPGLEMIDQNGGSSPLYLVLENPDGERLDTSDSRDRLAELQKAIDADPAIGSALSLSVLLDEAQRVPLANLLPIRSLVDLLDTAAYDEIASSFITEDRLQTLVFLRMRETGEASGAPRQEVIHRLVDTATQAGFQPSLVGGLYQLQAELGALVARSLIRGLLGLLLLFCLVAALVSRQLRTTLAMALSLVSVPLLVLGLFGHLDLAVDIISSPAANVAIALGIDSMIHLVLAVRRRRSTETAVAWEEARNELWQPIAGAVLILAGGFGIFALSSFPPTQRFGGAVALGTLAAGWVTLSLLPWLAAGGGTASRRATP